MKYIRNDETMFGTSDNAESVRYGNTNVKVALDGCLKNVDTINQNLNNINVYVGDDGKLHYVDKDGADSALPFSGIPKDVDFLYWTARNSVDTNQLNVTPSITTNKKYIMACLASSCQHTRILRNITISPQAEQVYYLENPVQPRPGKNTDSSRNGTTIIIWKIKAGTTYNVNMQAGADSTYANRPTSISAQVIGFN